MHMAHFACVTVSVMFRDGKKGRGEKESFLLIVCPKPFFRRSFSRWSIPQCTLLSIAQAEDGMLDAVGGKLGEEGINDAAAETRRAGKVRVARALFDGDAAKAAAAVASSKDAQNNAEEDVVLTPPDMVGEASLLDTSTASLVSLESETVDGATVLKVGSNPAIYVRGNSKMPPTAAFEEHKLFVGHIPREFQEADLAQVLEEFGPLAFVSVLRLGGRSRCCGFATYVNVEDRAKAIDALHLKRTLDNMKMPMQLTDANKVTEKTAKGKAKAGRAKRAPKRAELPCQRAVSPGLQPLPAKLTLAAGAGTLATSSGKTKQKQAPKHPPNKSSHYNLYVTMLSPNTTKEDLEMMFTRHGPIVDVSIQNDSCQRRCGLVSFSRQANAAAAVAALDRTVKFPECQTSMVVYFASPHEEKLFKASGNRRPERAKSTESGRGSPTGSGHGSRRSSQVSNGSSGTERRRNGSSSSVGSSKGGEQGRPRRSGSNSSSGSREDGNNHTNRSRSRSSSSNGSGGGGGGGRSNQQRHTRDALDHLAPSPFPASPMMVSYHPFSYKQNRAPPSPAPDVFGVPTVSIPMHRSMSPATYMYHTQPPPMSPQPPMVDAWYGGFQEQPIQGPGGFNINGMMSPQIDYSYQYVPEMVHEVPAPLTPAQDAPQAEFPQTDPEALIENSQPAEEFVGPPSTNPSEI